MVTTPTSPTVFVSDEKRRRITAERAKANHLLRQLQMRLQYARLKVDHGWQRQNLNEVENLYFTHSTIRGSVVTRNPTLQPVLPVQGHTIRDVSPAKPSFYMSKRDGDPPLQPSPELISSLPSPVPTPLPHLSAKPPSSQTLPSSHPPPKPPVQIQNHTPIPIPIPPPASASLPSPAPSPDMPNTPLPPPTTRPLVPGPAKSKVAATTDPDDPYGFKSASSSLTYDSFWAATSSKAGARKVAA